jgi:glutamate dehydrogenase
VCTLVLRDNARQALALALAERRSRADVMLFHSLIEYMTYRGTLDPAVEHLPNRARCGSGSARARASAKPELAIVLAYAKMGLYRRLLETDLPDEPHFQPAYLDTYFPGDPRALRGAVRAHPLRREIVATQMTNRVVDLLGPTFVHRDDPRHRRHPAGGRARRADRARGARRGRARGAARGRRATASGAIELEALDTLVGSVEGVVRWMLLNDLSGAAVAGFVGAYHGPLATVRVAARRAAAGAGAPPAGQGAAKGYARAGLPADLAAELAAFGYLPSSMGVVEVAHHTGTPLVEVGRLYFALGERLRLGWCHFS